MPEWLSIALNLGIGLPIAIVCVVVVREVFRACVAPLLGFRVFEIQWGAGETRFERPIGPVDLALARLPLGGRTIARSGSPARHRLGRAVLALAPPLLQLGWIVGRLAVDVAPGEAPLFAGLAPFACLDLANILLLVVHATVAVEISPGVGTDIRLLLDTLLGRADSNRAARANYYARLSRHRLERAQVEGARAALEQGQIQLGPAPLLVACSRRFDASDLTSVIDQGECADDLRRLIEEAEPRRVEERTRWSGVERARQTFFTALPLVIAIAALTFVQADRIARSAESGFSSLATRAVEGADGKRCAALRSRWSAWAKGVDPWLPPDAGGLADRHLALAGLARCAGDLASAAGHQGEAMLSAVSARTEPSRGVFSNPESWLRNEMRVVLLLRHAAQVELDNRRYKSALATIAKAERRLDELRTQLGLLPEESDRGEATEAVEREHAALVAARESVLTDLAAR